MKGSSSLHGPAVTRPPHQEHWQDYA